MCMRHQDSITELILARFDKVTAERNGLGPDAAVTGTIEPAPTAHAPATNGSTQNNGSGTSTPASSKKRAEPDEDVEESELSDVASTPPKKKHKKSTSVEDDAAFAARLQAEENGRARSTRGGGASRRKAPVKKKGESRKKKSKTKVNSDDDSELGSGSESKREVKRNGGFHVRFLRLISNTMKHRQPTLYTNSELFRNPWCSPSPCPNFSAKHSCRVLSVSRRFGSTSKRGTYKTPTTSGKFVAMRLCVLSSSRIAFICSL